MLLAGAVLDGSGNTVVNLPVPPAPALLGSLIAVQSFQAGANPALSNLGLLPIIN